MDLEEWEFLSDEGFFDREKKFSLSKQNSDSRKILDADYVLCSSPDFRKIAKSNQAVPADTIRPEAFDDELEKEISRNPDEIEADQATDSRFSFSEKENDHQFVDMKSRRGIAPPIDTRTLKFEDKAEIMEITSSPKLKIEKEIIVSSNRDDNKNDDGFNLWKWSFTGIGAICTFGVAAATICIFFLGSQSKNKLDHQHKKIRFQIYTNDKSIKQVVEHASKFNDAISAVRGGTSVNRAHITYSGYYDTL
ncbi:uncharacterized protein G2W53_040586 [Senna tora]|uniref:DUF6821 domain-containing protein n=1 Tax=Senna tora TaxID=362788 RepID=A0A834SCJ3_9FABA|nr:uncharacterized protein G2W53_040586 [Senna tora]